jgi:hypothetical protein
MEDEKKTKKQLIEELNELNKRGRVENLQMNYAQLHPMHELERTIEAFKNIVKHGYGSCKVFHISSGAHHIYTFPILISQELHHITYFVKKTLTRILEIIYARLKRAFDIHEMRIGSQKQNPRRGR